MRSGWLSFGVLCVCAASSYSQPKITYDQQVLPLLREKCLNCHNADKAKGGLDASSYGKLLEGGSSGVVIKPGDADGSRLFLLVSHKEEPQMPPKSPQLAKASLDMLKNWIDGGALENAGSKAVVVKKADVSFKASAMARPAVPPLPEKALSTQPIVHTARANAVTALAASPWAPLVAVAAPKQVLLYNTDTLDLVGVLPFAHGQVNVLKFSRSGELIMAAGGHGAKLGKVVLYSVKTGEIVTEVGDEPDAITAADLSPDQTMVAVGGPGRVVRVYAVADGSKVQTLRKHTEWVTAIEFSPDGKLLATGDRNGGLVLWEATTGREHLTLAGHKAAITDVSWRDDAGLLASSSEDGNIKLWETVDGKNTKSFAAGRAQSVKYGHDGRLFATAREGFSRLYDANGKQQREFTGVADLPLKAALTHNEGRVLVGDWAGVVTVWQTADAKKLGTLTTNPPTQAEQRERARATLAQKLQAFDVAQAALKRATEEERATVAARATAQTNMTNVETTLATAKSSSDKAQAKAGAVAKRVNDKPNEISAGQVKLIAYTVAYNHIQAEANKAKDNAALAKAAQDAKTLMDGCDKQVKDTQAELTKLTGEHQAAQQEVAKTLLATQSAEAAFKAAKAEFEGKSIPAKSASAKVAAAKATLDQATAERDAAEGRVARLGS